MRSILPHHMVRPKACACTFCNSQAAQLMTLVWVAAECLTLKFAAVCSTGLILCTIPTQAASLWGLRGTPGLQDWDSAAHLQSAADHDYPVDSTCYHSLVEEFEHRCPQRLQMLRGLMQLLLSSDRSQPIPMAALPTVNLQGSEDEGALPGGPEHHATDAVGRQQSHQPESQEQCEWQPLRLTFCNPQLVFNSLHLRAR